mmetsp:Transcript_3208/g.9001  ORF Transcript_3208/g.9001 Transcript_3208/m.9001 type:complete len:207 (-) Transcript_3208:682-1302(-)
MAITTASWPRASSAPLACSAAATPWSTSTSGSPAASTPSAMRPAWTVSLWSSSASGGRACTASGEGTTGTTCSDSASSRGRPSRRRCACPPCAPSARTWCTSPTTGRPAWFPSSSHRTTGGGAAWATRAASSWCTTWATTACTPTRPPGPPLGSRFRTWACATTPTTTATCGPSPSRSARPRGETRGTRARRSSCCAAASRWRTAW